MKKDTLKYLAPFAIVVISAIFVWNVITHGNVVHPGKPLYAKHCESCHSADGSGIKSLVPPLVNSDLAIGSFDSIPCWIKNGMNRPIVVNGVTFDQPMYPIELTDIQTANVMNYISEEFLKTDKKVNSKWVKQQWANCP